MKLSNILIEQNLKLNPITIVDSHFGRGYKSPIVRGDSLFVELNVDPYNTRVGEIEYGIVDENTIEIISIHIEKLHRGKGIATKAIHELVKKLNKKNVILLTTPTSIKFWKKVGFKPWSGYKNYFIKTFV